MNIMACRYTELQYTLIGYLKTGVQMIGYDGKRFFPSGLSDDIGLYYFVPKLLRFFGISLDHSISLFFYGMVFCAFVIGLTGFFLLSKSWLFRTIATVGLALFSYISCWGITDLYLVPSSLAIAVVPLALFFARRGKPDVWYGSFVFLSGIAAGYAHYLRSFSSVAVILFLLLSILLLRRVETRIQYENFVSLSQTRLFLFALLLVGLLIPFFHMKLLLKQRRQYFGPSYEQFIDRHVFWHTLYAGLGFLNNGYGIKWDDTTVCEHVKVIDPEVVYPSRAYEQTVKIMFFDLLKENPHFIMQTLFAKLGVIFYYLLLFANIGLLAAFFYRKSWQIELLFWSAMAFSCLFGIMALPGRYYLLGFLAFAFLYGIVSIGHAIDQGLIQDLLSLFRTKRIKK